MEIQYTIVLILLVVGVLIGVIYMMDSFIRLGNEERSNRGLLNMINEGLGISKASNATS